MSARIEEIVKFVLLRQVIAKMALMTPNSSWFQVLLTHSNLATSS